MTLGQDILYLSNADIEACGIGLADVELAVQAMFAAKAAGGATMKPKLALHAPERALFLAAHGRQSIGNLRDHLPLSPAWAEGFRLYQAIIGVANGLL